MHQLASLLFMASLLIAQATCFLEPVKDPIKEDPTVDETVDHMKGMAGAVKDNFNNIKDSLRSISRITEDRPRFCNQSNIQCIKSFSLNTYCCNNICCSLYDYSKKDT